MDKRWSEPSTWAGIGLLLSQLMPVLGQTVGMSDGKVQAFTALGAGLAATAAILKREKQ